MPGANCSNFGCTTSRYKKGVAVLKVPGGDDEYNTSWRGKLVHVVTKDRVITPGLRNQIQKRTIHVCERHFEESKLLRRKLTPLCFDSLLLPKGYKTSQNIYLANTTPHLP